MLTERGASYGYNNLVVDFRSLRIMADHPAAICFDATHSVQLPGAGDGESAGEREHVPGLARAAAAVGIDALFLEVHDAPARAICDRDNQWPLAELPALLDSILAIDRCARSTR